MSECVNSISTTRRHLSWQSDSEPTYEKALLDDSQLASWSGFRLGVFAATSGELVDQHGHHPSLGMILRGRTRARIRSRGQECDFSPGPDSVGVFGPKFDVSWTRWECEPGAERIMIELDLSALEQTGDLDVMKYANRMIKQDLTLRDKQLAMMVRLIAGEVRQGSPHGSLFSTSLSLALAAYLFNEHGSGGAVATQECGKLSSIQRARILDLMQARPAEELSLEEMASIAGISRFHFLRLFKNTFGVTPHRFVMERRIESARSLLKSTNLPIVEIAAITGFSSQSHMSTAMRRSLGSTPGKLRLPG